VLTSPFDIALAVALASLPLLFGIWLLLFGRTFAEARRAREAQTRLALAAELGLRPRELTSMSTQALFKLREQAAFDDLTGAMRRGAGISAIEREIARARRHKSALCVAFVDIDGLKAANDRHGHAAGDKLLKGLAQALKEGLRGQDLVLRYGGDEFVCVLPDTRAEAGRAKLSWILAEARKAGIGFSVGLAQLERSDDVVSLLARADRELYELKARRGGIVQLPQAGERGRQRADPPTDSFPIDSRG
jgi:diguanylate cyclase (GGDEF)-like protein